MNLTNLLLRHSHLTTARLLLRPVTLADAPAMLRYASDPRVTEFVFPTQNDLATTEENILQYFLAAPAGKYGIELQDEHEFIGTIDLRLDSINLSAEIGYVLNHDYWGQGYAPEACRALIELGFNILHLKRIEARHHTANSRSGRVMQKIGMRQEGILRNARQFRGRTVAEAIYALTDADFAAAKR